MNWSNLPGLKNWLLSCQTGGWLVSHDAYCTAATSILCNIGPPISPTKLGIQELITCGISIWYQIISREGTMPGAELAH